MNTTDEHFAAAWVDLGKRITRATTALETMPYEERRASKLEGLQDAQFLYEDLDASEEDAASKWRTFTYLAFADWRAKMNAGNGQHASGVALALEYQRGYGPNIDAPGLDTLMVAHR